MKHRPATSVTRGALRRAFVATDLADICGVSREALSRIKKKYAGLGVLGDSGVSGHEVVVPLRAEL